MSLVELIPAVRSLSRSDKLRLIQWLAGDLAGTEDLPSKPTGGRIEEIEEDDSEIREDERVREAIHAMGLDAAIGLMEEEGIKNGPGKVDLTHFDRTWSRLIESGQSLPIRFPDQSYEAAVMLLRALEEEKSAS